MKVSELADALKISKKMVYILHEEARVPGGLKLGERTLRFRPNEVLNWLSHHSTRGPVKSLEMLLPEAAADILNLKKKHIYELVRRGVINGVRIGRLIRVPQEEVERLIGQVIPEIAKSRKA